VPRRRQPRTILEATVARAGGGMRAIPKATRVGTFIAEWAFLLATGEVEPPLTTEKVGVYFNESEATMYRRLREFRELYPEFETPQPIAELLVDYASRRRGPVALLAAPAPSLVPDRR
jgi:hypothetical protein